MSLKAVAGDPISRANSAPLSIRDSFVVGAEPARPNLHMLNRLGATCRLLPEVDDLGKRTLYCPGVVVVLGPAKFRGDNGFGNRC